jgi:hypothetical protein
MRTAPYSLPIALLLGLVTGCNAPTVPTKLFEEVTTSSGLVAHVGMTHGVAWGDFDGDGLPDVYVTNHLDDAQLFRNLGKGRFADVTKEFFAPGDLGGDKHGAAWADVDNDGRLDLFIGNETGPSELFRQKGDGTFEDISKPAGVDRTGFIKGVVAEDYDNDGYVDFYLSDFNGDNLLYHNNHNRTFTEVGEKAGVQEPYRSFAAWFFDYDNDGWPDILVADGHIEDQIEKVQKRVSYAEPPHVFRNLGGGKFVEVTQSLGGAFASPRVGRGAAYADIDNDGALDVLMTTNGGRAYLFHNEGVTNHSLRIKLVGTKSNRDGIGAVITVNSGVDKQSKMLRSGSSYLSQSELAATFGLGQKTKADSIEIQWPSGQADKLANVAAGETVTVQESKGIVASRGYGPAVKKRIPPRVAKLSAEEQ